MKEMRRLVLNPSTSASILEEIFEKNRQETHAHAIWVGLSIHPRFPDTLRETIFPHLFWRDLLKVLDCPAVPERAKQKVMQLLQRRMERVAAGEWKAFARACSPKLFPWVMKQDQDGLFAVLLENPRMTETALVRLIHSPAMKPEFSVQIVDNRVWRKRRSVRKALVYSKKSDLTSALVSLKGMTKSELKEVEGTYTLHPLILMSARALIREKGGLK
ncbi:MAG: hypothetical protein GXO70_01485 [Acidobacteria bacterium]|nr:hypothetical protein [Acidobacteriota bacterium]